MTRSTPSPKELADQLTRISREAERQRAIDLARRRRPYHGSDDEDSSELSESESD